MTIWLDGHFMQAESARVAVNDRGFLLGDGLFETLRISGGQPCLFERHWQRLTEGAATLGIPVGRQAQEIQTAIQHLSAGTDGAARLTLTRGPAPRGLRPPATPAPTWLVATAPSPVFDPVDLVVAAHTCRNERSPLARIKSLNYLDSIVALQEAIGRGAGDALMLNTAGRIAEATAANVFLVLDGSLVTPPLSDGPLPGIARAILLERGVGAEISLSPDVLTRVSAGILTNSLGIRPIRRLEGRGLDDAMPLVHRCRAAIQDAGG